MKIKHHGAVNGVTGSCHELSFDNNNSVLIDCGLFQGAETSNDGASFEKLQIEFPVEHIRALFVTHCHIDHVGRIPYLFAAGFNGPIYCTKPTAELLPLVLEDALKIGFTKNKTLIQRALKQITKNIIGIHYYHWMTLPESTLKARFSPAGHILGSAYIQFDLGKHEKNRRIIFSGDLGAPYTPLLPSAKSPYQADVLIIESTYGDRLHGPRRDRHKTLKQLIEKCVTDNGVVLIPAFSIGRTQELLYEFEHIIHSNKKMTHKKSDWENIEIIVDSPMAAKFTQTYRKLKTYWDKEARRKKTAGRHPLSFSQITTIGDHREHTQTVAYLKKHQRPAIVIAASGMCSGGRIVNYLKALIEDKRTDILFVGYQAQGTPGREIQNWGPKNGHVTLDGKRYNINAGTNTISGYSAHADQKDLVNFVKRMRKKPSEIRIIHGDKNAKRALRSKLMTLLPESKIHIPKN